MTTPQGTFQSHFTSKYKISILTVLDSPQRRIIRHLTDHKCVGSFNSLDRIGLQFNVLIQEDVKI